MHRALVRSDRSVRQWLVNMFLEVHKCLRGRRLLRLLQNNFCDCQLKELLLVEGGAGGESSHLLVSVSWFQSSESWTEAPELIFGANM